MAVSLTWTFPRPLEPATRRSDAGAKRNVSAAPSDRPIAELGEMELVEACLAGRSEAFDLIVERHRRAVYQLCYRFVGTHEDASDLSQDVFLRAYRGLRTFRGQSTLATWLYRIGVNVCLNRVNTRNPMRLAEPIGEAEFADTSAESQAERVIRVERSARVRAAIAALPRKQRATLILRTYHELSHQEIAALLGSSVGAVKANFFHALGNLKRILGEEP